MLLTEPELFDFLKEFYYPDLQMSSDEYSHYDCISKEHKLYIELKSRYTHYDDLIIEWIKYEALNKAASLHSCIPVYINATPKGIWKFELWADLKWETRSLPATTEFPNKNNKDKLISYLHIKDGVRL